MKKIYFVLLFTFYSLLFSPHTTAAIDMFSPRFRIKYGNVNIGGNRESSANYNLTTTLGQTAAGEFQSAGYIVKAGFQYFQSIIPFSFSISNININLGTLIASTPSTANTTLTVSFGSAGQYQVTAIEEGTLRTLSSNFIPDTTCDSGCTETSAALWTNNGNYGFGYNMTGQDIPADFLNSNYYRPFPDRTAAESPSVVMSNVNVGRGRQSTVKFKANISSIQASGTYQTIINFVATPSF